MGYQSFPRLWARPATHQTLPAVSRAPLLYISIFLSYTIIYTHPYFYSTLFESRFVTEKMTPTMKTSANQLAKCMDKKVRNQFRIISSSLHENANHGILFSLILIFLMSIDVWSGEDTWSCILAETTKSQCTQEIEVNAIYKLISIKYTSINPSIPVCVN